MKKRSLLTVLLSGILFLIPLSSCGLKSPGGNTPDIPLPPVITYVDVSTVEELKGLSGQKENYRLVNDIDLAGVEWTPIDNFTGILEGNGKKISGFSISSNKTNLGLFSTLGGTVKNLSLVDVSINCTGDEGTVGALCGTNTGTIENVAVSGEISAKYYNNVGGIAGTSTNSNITKCKNECVVTAYDNVGGIVGVLTTGAADTFTENENNGEINGNSCVGGIAGLVNTSYNLNNLLTIISNHKNNGEINGAGNNIGGILGNATGCVYTQYSRSYTHSMAISGCTNNSKIKGNDNTGGILGYGNYVDEITACDNKAEITGNNYVGGFAGLTSTRTTLKILENTQIITGKAYIGGIAGSTGRLFSCTNSGEVVSTGVITESSTFISCVGGLAGCATSIEKCINKRNIEANNDGLYVGGLVGKLTPANGSVVLDSENNANVSGYKYVGGLVGIIKISSSSESNWVVKVDNNKNNSAIIGSNDYVGGLFGSAEGSTYTIHGRTYVYSIAITNCINNQTVTGNNYTGGITGYGTYVDEISTCENKANITGNNYVGGYAGCTTTRTLMKILDNNQTITGNAYVGGIAGSTGKLLNCNNNGSIISKGIVLESAIAISCVGGIAGQAESMESCTNNINISVLNEGRYVGGLVGKMNAVNGSVLKNCKNFGDITSNGSFIGGLVGYLRANDSAETNWTLLVENCENNGAIKNTGTSDYTGGLVGDVEGSIYTIHGYSYSHMVSFSNCSNTKSVTGNNYTGGLIGYGTYVKEINLCSNIGDVFGKNYVGGYVGFSSETLIQFANNTNKISGNAYVGGIAGYTGSLKSCNNHGEVISNGIVVESSVSCSYVGGIAGFATSLESCTNDSNISVETGGQYVGGLVGYLKISISSVFKTCINNGDITSRGSYAGGLVGYLRATDASETNWTLIVENCQNFGVVNASGDYAAGIAGCAIGETYTVHGYSYTHTISFSNCENRANITGNKYVGGILGRGSFVDKTVAIWETNINYGIITGETSGELYGELA